MTSEGEVLRDLDFISKASVLLDRDPQEPVPFVGQCGYEVLEVSPKKFAKRWRSCSANYWFALEQDFAAWSRS